MDNVELGLFAPVKVRAKRAKVHLDEKRAVLSEVTLLLRKRGHLPMDNGAKGIMATQVGALLKMGYAYDLIRIVALRIAATKTNDPFRFTHLHREVVLAAAEREKNRPKEVREPSEAVVAAIRASGVLKKRIPPREEP